MFLMLLFSFLCLSLALASPTVILITGCSTGIGKAIARRLALQEKGFKVWATMRNPSSWSWNSEEEEDFVHSANNFRAVALDVTDEANIAAVIERIISEDGKIDVLINNAGYGISGTTEMVEIDEAKALFDVNLWGVVRLAQHVLPYMRAQYSKHHLQFTDSTETHIADSKDIDSSKCGYIINLRYENVLLDVVTRSSTSGIRGLPAYDFYASSKFALEGLMDSLRYSVAPFGVSITNINAGPVRTDFTSRFGVSEKGGAGTRTSALQKKGEDSTWKYVTGLTTRMVNFLKQRMQSSVEGQSVDELGQLVVNLIYMKKKSKHPGEVPFNIGSNAHSQKVVDAVRKQGNGWGPFQHGILDNVPSVFKMLMALQESEKEVSKKDEL